MPESPPADLEARGAAFWRAVLADFEPSDAERELLAEAARTMDELQALRKAVIEDGPTTTGSRGQTVTHPALAELRQGRAELRRLLDQLAIPPPEGDVTSLAELKARKAADKRWAGKVATRA